MTIRERSGPAALLVIVCLSHAVGATSRLERMLGLAWLVAAGVHPSLLCLLAQFAAEVAAQAGILALDVTLIPAVHGGMQDGLLCGRLASSHGLDGARHDQLKNEPGSGNGGEGISSLMASS